MNNTHRYQQTLSKYLPVESIDLIVDWIIEYNIGLKISRSRTTKLGDYHYPSKKHGHRISINQDLNKYAFLITLVHEIAHLVNWEKCKNKVKPHGSEWKNEYQLLMKIFTGSSIFPSDISGAINKHMANPFASSCTDIGLMRILRKYDPSASLRTGSEIFTCLEEIPHATVFKIKNGRTFYKGEKLRKRYKCKDMDNHRIYLFSPLAEVTMITRN